MVRSGASFALGVPLWEGAAFSAVLIGEPGEPVPDLELDGAEPVRFLPVLPITDAEHAYKRVHGPDALSQLWTEQNIDLADPARLSARLSG